PEPWPAWAPSGPRRAPCAPRRRPRARMRSLRTSLPVLSFRTTRNDAVTKRGLLEQGLELGVVAGDGLAEHHAEERREQARTPRRAAGRGLGDAGAAVVRLQDAAHLDRERARRALDRHDTRRVVLGHLVARGHGLAHEMRGLLERRPDASRR